MKFQKADWNDLEIARANYELNKSYFETEQYKTLPAYYKLKEAIEFIILQENKKLDLLDIGCGSGWHAEYLKREGLFSSISYTGLDASEHMKYFAQIVYPEGNFIVSNIVQEQLSLSFDIVMESAVLELVEDWKDMVKNMIGYSNKYLILHRMFYCDDETFTQQTVTYNDIPDIRTIIGLKDLEEILNQFNFILIRSDIWRSDMGTFIAKRADK